MKINTIQSALRGALVLAFVLSTALVTKDTYAASASSNATATVVAPIAISNTQDLAFGSFSTSATNQTVTISAAGARSSVGAIVVPSSTATAASFSVTGDTTGTPTYAITLPASTTITNGTDTFTVDTFTSNPSGTGTLTAGAQTLTVGATVTTAGTLSTGNYTGTFSVSVDYN